MQVIYDQRNVINAQRELITSEHDCFSNHQNTTHQNYITSIFQQPRCQFILHQP